VSGAGTIVGVGTGVGVGIGLGEGVGVAVGEATMLGAGDGDGDPTPPLAIAWLGPGLADGVTAQAARTPRLTPPRPASANRPTTADLAGQRRRLAMRTCPLCRSVTSASPRTAAG
jgi:hypothetical protein